MIIDLTGKSLDQVIGYLKDKGYIPCKDTDGTCGYLTCSCDEYDGYCETNECYRHEKYDIRTYECDCSKIFYEIIANNDELPNRWETIDGIMVGLE